MAGEIELWALSGGDVRARSRGLEGMARGSGIAGEIELWALSGGDVRARSRGLEGTARGSGMA